MVIALSYYASVYSVPNVWPTNYSLTVPNFGVNGKNGSVAFVPRSFTTPTTLGVDTISLYTENNELQSGVPLSNYDFTLAPPYFIKIEVSFTTSEATNLIIQALSYSKTKYNTTASDVSGTKDVGISGPYTGFNVVTLDFEPDSDNFLGYIYIRKFVQPDDSKTLVINKIRFIYPTITLDSTYGGGDSPPTYNAACPIVNFAPEQAGYGFTHKAETHAIELDGGSSRYRKDFIGQKSLINAQWTLRKKEFEYLTALFKNAANQTVNIPLYLDTATNLTTLAVNLIPGSLKLVSLTAMNFTVSCQLEATPLAFSTTWPANL